MKQSNRMQELVVTLPSFIWLFLFFLIPSIILVILAFKPADIYGGLEGGWTLDNFKKLFNPNYISVIWRTIWLSTLATLTCISLSLPVGYYLAQAETKVRNLFLLLIVMPFWSSFLVRIFAWKSFLHPEGIFKQALVKLHLISEETSLLYHSGTVLLVMIYTYLPFAILPIYAAASKFNFQLIEAAMDLGSSQFRSFFQVFIPGIHKSIWTALLMVFIPAMGAYVIPDLVGGTQSELIGNKIAQRTFVDRDLPQASALSLLLSLVVLVPSLIVVFAQSRSEKYETAPKE
jgi:spermidine/putrescine transport system permease protein